MESKILSSPRGNRNVPSDDLRPWNNSFLKLLLEARKVDELELILGGVEENLEKLYEVCTSDEVMSLYWRMRDILILFRTASTTARAFSETKEEKIQSGKDKKIRDIGIPLLVNGLNHFVSRVNDSAEILKALAKPCSHMPREIYGRLSTSLMKLQSLSLFLEQDQRRKRSKKNRNQKSNQKEGISSDVPGESTDKRTMSPYLSKLKNCHLFLIFY